MTPEQVTQLLERLAEMLNPAASQAWQLAMRQVYAVLWMNVAGLIVSTLAIVGGIWASKWAHRKDKNVPDFSDDAEGYAVIMVISVVLVFAAVFAWVILLFSVIGMAINPEWYAIRYLLGLFGG